MGRVTGIRPQNSCIAQSCPISPYLFIIMLSVLLDEVQQEFLAQVEATQANGSCDEVVYADDTVWYRTIRICCN